MQGALDVQTLRHSRHTATQPLTQAPATSTGFHAPSLPTISNHCQPQQCYQQTAIDHLCNLVTQAHKYLWRLDWIEQGLRTAHLSVPMTVHR